LLTDFETVRFSDRKELPTMPRQPKPKQSGYYPRLAVLDRLRKEESEAQEAADIAARPI
jgi:hypothetical protein